MKTDRRMRLTFNWNSKGLLKYYILRLESFRGLVWDLSLAQLLDFICLLLILNRPSQIETMVDNADIKCKSPGGSRPVTCTGPSSFDLGPGYQAPIVRKVYKRRFIGVAHLALLNIVVSWDVSYRLPTTLKQKY